MPSASASAVRINGVGVLDLGSTHIGWAHWRYAPDGNVELSGAVDLRKLVATEDPWSRVNAFAFWLTDWLKRHPCDALVVEEPFSPPGRSGTQSVRLLNTIYGICRLAALRLKIEFRDVIRAEAVKHVMGYASRKNPETDKMEAPSKDQVRRRVEELEGRPIASEDEADAIATRRLILAEIAGTGQLRPNRAEVATMKREHARGVQKRKKARILRKAQAEAASPALPEMLTNPPKRKPKRADIPVMPVEQRAAELAKKSPAAVAWPGFRRGQVARGRDFGNR